MKHTLTIAAFLFIAGLLSAQEALKSVEEDYYDFLALRGLTERPSLNYRTLSDSAWTVEGNAAHPWEGQNLGKKSPLFGDVSLRLYGPELFNSFNTTAPYGQNDGVLWQGRGYNGSLSAGARLEGYGLELTLKPQLAFSQNLPFPLMESAYDSEYGYFWGYLRNVGADAPQRFGDEPFFDYSFGDSEIRYTWKTLTIGFGTQSPWLGPASLNPILHSNNAPPYPKLDLGMRRQPLTIPWINWYAGDVEWRFWTGYLSESGYFDRDDSNNHNMFHGFSFAYAPSFLPGLVLSANRVCLVPWGWNNLKYIIPMDANTYEDQKASFGASWLFPEAGLEIYGEAGIDDYIGGWVFQYIRYPFHTTVFTAGLKKTVPIAPGKNIHGEIVLETNWFSKTWDYASRAYSFYFHSNITQGYTNRGQWLGSGIGAGGNSQYLGFTLYYPRGSGSLFIARNNPDLDFMDHSQEAREKYPILYASLANFNAGVSGSYFINSMFSVSGGITYNRIINPRYAPEDKYDDNGKKLHYSRTTYWENFSFQLGLKISL